MKTRALQAVEAALRADLEGVLEAQRRAGEATTHPEAKQESAKDTRAIETGYLARGLARRAEQLLEAVARFERLEIRAFDNDDEAGLTALVTVEDPEGETARYLLLPMGAGVTVTVDSHVIRVVTPRSPVGRALMGRQVDDEVNVQVPGGTRELLMITLS